MSTFLIVLTSAAVGTFISQLLTIFGQFLERKSRRKELLISKAIELAFGKTELAKDVAFKSGKPATFTDPVILAWSYYRDLEMLLDKGDLSEETKNRAAKKEKELQEKEQPSL